MIDILAITLLLLVIAGCVYLKYLIKEKHKITIPTETITPSESNLPKAIVEDTLDTWREIFDRCLYPLDVDQKEWLTKYYYSPSKIRHERVTNYRSDSVIN